MKKRILSIGLVVAMVISLVACGGSSTSATSKTYTIGIGQFAEHGSLDNCREGFIQGLKEEGFEEGKNVVYKYENAQTDGSIMNQIVTNFVSSKVDMICAIATPIAQAAYSATRETDIPVIYTAITDPIMAQLANADKTPVGNITGTSDKLPVQQQLQLIHEMYPNATNVGILFTNSEVNSLSAIEDYKKYATDFGFNIVTVGINDTSEISMACDNILTKVDVLTNLTDNTVVASLPLVLEKANAKKVPVFGSEIEQVKLGCIACMGLDYIELGKQTGHMAAKVLKGEKKATDIPFEVIENASLYVNTKVAGELGYTFSDELLNKAVEKFN